MKKPVKQRSKENIYSLTGFGKVFRFTLMQTLKNKGFLVTAILMIFMMSMMKPLMYGMSKSSENAAKRMDASLENIEADNLIVYNETQYEFNKEMETAPDMGEKPAGAIRSENIKFLNKEDAKEEDLIAGLGEKDILVVIRLEGNVYKMNGIIADQSKVGVKSLDNATSFVEGRFNAIRQEQMKLDSKAIQSITAGVATGSVMSEKAYESEKENTMSTSEYNGLIVGFSIIIMIVSSLAASYIIASVNEEKQSKLAESLLVSVRPMALLLGKVLGMLTFVAGTIILGVIGSSIVNYVMENVMKLDMSTLSKAGLNLAIFTSYGAKGLVVFLVEILVGLCSFGVLSGILGSACGKTEDQQNATTLITTITMIGYFATIFLGMKPEYALIGTLVPPVSYFMAPVAYIGGRVGLEMLLASFAIQIVILICLVILAAKTYRNLLLSDSSKPRLAAIFAAAKN